MEFVIFGAGEEGLYDWVALGKLHAANGVPFNQTGSDRI